MGWTGQKCPACKGSGEVAGEHYDVPCPACGGTGDEHVPDTEAPGLSPLLWPQTPAVLAACLHAMQQRGGQYVSAARASQERPATYLDAFKAWTDPDQRAALLAQQMARGERVRAWWAWMQPSTDWEAQAKATLAKPVLAVVAYGDGEAPMVAAAAAHALRRMAQAAENAALRGAVAAAKAEDLAINPPPPRSEWLAGLGQRVEDVRLRVVSWRSLGVREVAGREVEQGVYTLHTLGGLITVRDGTSTYVFQVPAGCVVRWYTTSQRLGVEAEVLASFTVERRGTYQGVRETRVSNLRTSKVV